MALKILTIPLAQARRSPAQIVAAMRQQHQTTVAEPPPQIVPVVPPVVPTEVQTLTMEYLELHRRFRQYNVKDLVDRMEAIRKQLHLIANDTLDDRQEAVFVCVEGEIEFSERGEVTEVTDLQALFAHLVATFGVEVAFSTVDVALTRLRQVLSDRELEPFVEKRPGSRRIKAVRPKPVS